MKNPLLFIIILANILISVPSFGQQSPLWTRNITTSPDSASLFPVKTLTDNNNDVFVLSFYRKYIAPSIFIDKINLNKFDTNGNLLWNLVFDNNGAGNARSTDMALDSIGNCIIAGSTSDSLNDFPLILKVSGAGNIIWQRDSTLSFNEGQYNQVIIKNSLIYLGGRPGIAVFDLNGVEQWSHPVGSIDMVVDNQGRLAFMSDPISNQMLFRYDVSGNLDFADSTIYAEKIAVDGENSYYILGQYPYELLKYDSNGVLQWMRNSFPLNLSFSDLSFDVLTTLYNEVLVIGLSDTMFKFRKDGTELWRKSMDGLDNYLTDAQITDFNFLAIGGTLTDTLGYYVMVAFFDINGNRSWYGTYNSNDQQEFAKSIAISGDGVYLLEDSVSTSSIIKFENPFFTTPVNFDLLCVDSVWYEPGNQGLINVRIFNGGIAHLNYPSVQIVSPAGDTISNIINFVNFFAHLSNDYQVYQDTIVVPGIADFTNYTFVMSESFGDTSVAINLCSTVGIENVPENMTILFPNPASQILNLKFQQPCLNCGIEIFSEDGKICLSEKLTTSSLASIVVSDLSTGFYILRLTNQSMSKHFRFIKQ